MERILISWIAVQNDFNKLDDGGFQINLSGPTYTFHKHFQEHDKHVLLSSASDEEKDIRAKVLRDRLQTDFGHDITIEYLDLQDIINLQEVQEKVLPVLVSLRACKVDIFFLLVLLLCV